MEEFSLLFCLLLFHCPLYFLYSQEQRAQFLFVFFLDELLSSFEDFDAINLVNREVSSRVLVSNPETVRSLFTGGGFDIDGCV